MEAWINVLQCILWLRRMGLLSAELTELDDFRDSSGRPLPSVRQVTEEHTGPHGPGGARGRTDLSSGSGSGGGMGSLITSALSLLWSSPPPTPAPSGLSLRLPLAVADTSSTAITAPLAAGPADRPDPPETRWAAQARDVMDQCRIMDIFAGTKFFRPQPLTHMIRALVLVSAFASKSLSVPKPPVAIESFGEPILDEESAVFCLERLSDIIEKNQGRLDDSNIKLWPTLHHHFDLAVSRAPGSTFYLGMAYKRSTTHTNVYTYKRLMPRWRCSFSILKLTTCVPLQYLSQSGWLSTCFDFPSA